MDKGILDFNKEVLIIAHDIGGAINIMKILKFYKLTKTYAVAEGPAKKIFEKSKSINFLQKKDDVFYLKKFNILIGTGWNVFEINWMKYLKLNNILFNVCLDNWVFFKERFFNPIDGKNYWPNTIFTLDQYAYNLAKANLSIYVENIICLNLEEKNKSSDESKLFKAIKFSHITRLNNKLHFISQPIRESRINQEKYKYARFNYPQIDQVEIFNLLYKFLIKNLRFKIKNIEINFHPSESNESISTWKDLADKYDNICVSKFDGIFNSKSIYVGMNSSLLLEALSYSKFTYSMCNIINWDEKLPHDNIGYL
tara:strand:+ start:1524 stop:2456 length:933 start_codon:yes stop_codon:yes gene_type:complete